MTRRKPRPPAHDHEQLAALLGDQLLFMAVGTEGGVLVKQQHEPFRFREIEDPPAGDKG